LDAAPVPMHAPAAMQRPAAMRAAAAAMHAPRACFRASGQVSDAKVANGTVSSLAKFQVDSGKLKLNKV
jgi:hypothetical protein